jgi:hypothetical protein
VENYNKGKPLFWRDGKVKKKPPLTDLMKGSGGLWGFRAKEPVRPIGQDRKVSENCQSVKPPFKKNGRFVGLGMEKVSLANRQPGNPSQGDLDCRFSNIWSDRQDRRTA